MNHPLSKPASEVQSGDIILGRDDFARPIVFHVLAVEKSQFSYAVKFHGTTVDADDNLIWGEIQAHGDEPVAIGDPA